MPPGLFSVTEISVFEAVGVLLAALVLGFFLGRVTKEVPPPPKAQPLPTKADLAAMSETLRSWMGLADAVAGWKAAAYGAIGVIIGAAGGLFAEYVIRGDMSPTQVYRAAGALAFLLGVMAVAVLVIEVCEPLEPLVKKLRALQARRAGKSTAEGPEG
jgi:hypothetical protein